MNVTCLPVGKRRWFALLLLISAAVGGGTYLGWRSRPRVVLPEVPSAGVEPAVVAEIEQARSTVLADPNSAPAWGQVGLVLFANDFYGHAIPWLEQAERMDPTDVRWPYFRGLALLLEHPEEGLEALRRATILAPRDAFVRLRWAEALLAADSLDEAEKAFTEVISQQPDNARAMLGRGQILLRRGDPAAAIPLLEKASSHPTAQKAALSGLAEAYQRLARQDQADAIRQRAADVPPDTPWMDPKIVRISVHQVSRRGRLEKALNLMRTDRADDAIAELLRLLREEPDFTEARLALVRAFIVSHDLSRAEEEVQNALATDPSHPDAHVLAGGLALVRGDIEGAEAAYRRALEHRPSDAVAWFNVADCRLRRNDRPGAIEALKQALRYRPGFVVAHLKLAEMFLDAQQWSAARVHLDAVDRIQPNHPQAVTLKNRLPNR